VESQKLRRRPQSWRLACQSLVQRSLVVLTRPQSGLTNAEAAWEQAHQQILPTGPLAWPEPEEETTPDGEAVEPSDAPPTATTDEGPREEEREQ
jgi:hypothetical protein